MTSIKNSSTIKHVNKKNSVEMYLRIKPIFSLIKKENIYQILDSSILLIKPPSSENNVQNSSRNSDETAVKRHVFTKIFESETSQAEMFEQSIKHRIAEFLDGKSSTIMTYGPRDSGKTYTLFGTSTSPGIIMRSIQLVFSKKKCYCHLIPQASGFCLDEKTRQEVSTLKIFQDNQEFTKEATRFLENSKVENFKECKECDKRYSYNACLSFIQIYNGKIYDLLNNNLEAGMIMFDEGPYIYCSQMLARTALEACKIFLLGQSQMFSNSRIHTIFKIKLLRYENHTSDKVTYSTLTFCDLAGLTQFKTEQLVYESILVNNDLLALNRCLRAVSKNEKTYLTYSETILKILKPALSGQENLSFIVNVAFTSNFHTETQDIFNLCHIIEKQIDVYQEYKKSHEFEKTSPETCNAISLPFIRQTLSETAEKATSTNIIEWSMYKYMIKENEWLKSKSTNLQKQIKKLITDLETAESNLNCEHTKRKQLTDHYSHMIEEMDAIYKKHTTEIKTERHDLLKWSVELVENFYKERIDNMMRHKKRKQGGSGDYIDRYALYEELENENAQVTSKLTVLKETVKKLRDENKIILCKKNKCSFELALITKELKKFRQLTQSTICKWKNNIKNHSFINNLERLMCEEIKMTEMKLEKINEYFCTTKDEDAEDASKAIMVNQDLSKLETLLNDTLKKIERLEKRFSLKEMYADTLKNPIQIQENQLTVVQQCLNDIKDDDIKNKKYKCESTNTSFYDTADSSELDNVLISSTGKNSLQESNMSSSTTDKRDFDNWIVVPELFATSRSTESTGKKLSDTSDIDLESFLKNNDSMDCSVSRSSDKDDSGVSSGLQNGSRRSINVNNSTHIHESEDRYTQILIEDNTIVTGSSTDLKEQNHEKTLHVTELSEDLKTIKDVIYTLNEVACADERKITEHKYQFYEEKIQEKSFEDEKEIPMERDAFPKMVEDKIQECKREISELTHKLIVKEENEDQISKCLDKYIEKFKYLENKLSLMRKELNKAFNKCADEHLPIIESLKDKVLHKTLHINDLDRKIVEMQHEFAKDYELFEKIHDFEIILKKCQRDKNELCRQLNECLETQLTLETKLKDLTMQVAKRESKVISLKNEIRKITDLNRSNDEKARNLSKQVIEASESIDSTKKDLQRCKDLRKNVENVEMQINLKSRFSDYKNNTAFLNGFCKTCDDNQDEIIRLKMQLEYKELEMARLKNSIDVITQKYEILVKHLQDKIQEKDKQFKTVINVHNLNNLERAFTENSTLSEINSSLEFNPIIDSHEKPIEDPEQLIESFAVDEGECSLTDSICLISKPVNSDILDISSINSDILGISSVSSEDSTKITSFNEENGDNIKSDS